LLWAFSFLCLFPAFFSLCCAGSVALHPAWASEYLLSLSGTIEQYPLFDWVLA
jgi:hypothetical protein